MSFIETFRLNLRGSGVFRFLAVGLFPIALLSCDRSRPVTWEKTGQSITAAGQGVIETPPPPAPEDPPEQDTSLRFIAYNVKNWLTMDRYHNRRNLKSSSKPAEEKEAVIAILARHRPDVIGLCEIGTVEDLTEIQELLKEKGLHLPHSHFTGGSDQVRHLGLLSRYPVTGTGKAEKLDYTLRGKLFTANRGILDASIEAKGKPYRFLGVHFKSKREVNDGDQEEMRRAEAYLLRRHVDSILRGNPGERLVVYGDFNDSRASVSGKSVVGSFNSPGYLTAIPAQDSSGTRWTHFWALHDVYARIDFIAVSPALKPDTDFRAAKILDDPEWETASDHRAILAIFK